ncbi:hypothetical protein Fmac_014045 [Flemingia macrophylla]|uniref:Transcription factor CBF/NF-Y/archaeal histone domain-containing protein n=1 Tax=Flemingia macrophylla TaxID=520843 RepID=A0ABD1MAK1_9FABA
MENGGSFFRQQERSSSGSTLPSQQANNNGPVPNFDENIKMPITNVTKISGEVIPDNGKVSDGAKELLQESATEFITFVTSKAKERSQSKCRKIMNVEDVLWAMDKLGFDDYAVPLATFLERSRRLEGDSFTRRKRPNI